MGVIRGLQFEPDALTQEALVPDPWWGSKCVAFNVQADVPESAASRLEVVQSALDAAVPGQRLVPPHAMHISVLNLITSRSSMADDGKLALWQHHEQRWLKAIDELVAETASFDIVLRHAVLAPSGLLVAATDCVELIALRRRIADALDLPLRPPELSHVTLMRFGPEVPSVSAARRAVHEVRVDATWRVSRLRTVRELRYPSLERATIRTHPLDDHGWR